MPTTIPYTTVATRLSSLLETVLQTPMPVRIRAWDGSTAGPADAPTLIIRHKRAMRRFLWQPNELGLARAYVAGEVDLEGDLYDALNRLAPLVWRSPDVRDLPFHTVAADLLRLGVLGTQPKPPPEEMHVSGVRHSKRRDRQAVSQHYDVGNDFYRIVLGESMVYSCAYWTSEAPGYGLADAQRDKLDLICRKLDLKPGMRLLDVGCGWGGMVRHAAREYGVRALGVTLSEQQALWAQEAIKRDGLDHLAEVRFLDYREVPETDFDAVSSIGLTEHIGVRNYPAYFASLRDKLRPEGRLLNHCITRPHNRPQDTGEFLDRYVFPDGELTGSGRIITEAQNVGLEVMHEENFRLHYARTLAGWCQNLRDNWDACVDEVGEGTARVWGLYMAGSRLAFERNEIQLHQILATKTSREGVSQYPLRPDWTA